MAGSAQAAGSIYSGEYTVQFSAVNSMQIPASVARENGFERAGDKAVLMITVQKPTDSNPLNAVPADVSGYAHDLMGNNTTLLFNRIKSDNSIYSLTTVPISDNQTLTFELEIKADQGAATIPLRFNQTFFTE